MDLARRRFIGFIAIATQAAMACAKIHPERVIALRCRRLSIDYANSRQSCRGALPNTDAAIQPDGHFSHDGELGARRLTGPDCVS
jgi:hypothetical protein